MGPPTEPGAGPVVHLLCGLNGAGMTTHARALESAGAVRFTLDEWMIALWPDLRSTRTAGRSAPTGAAP